MQVFKSLVADIQSTKMESKYYIFHNGTYSNIWNISKRNKYYMSSFNNTIYGKFFTREISEYVNNPNIYKESSFSSSNYSYVIDRVSKLINNTEYSIDEINIKAYNIYSKINIDIISRNIVYYRIYDDDNNKTEYGDISFNSAKESSKLYVIIRYINNSYIHVYSLSDDSICIVYKPISMFKPDENILLYVFKTLNILDVPYMSIHSISISKNVVKGISNEMFSDLITSETYKDLYKRRDDKLMIHKLKFLEEGNITVRLSNNKVIIKGLNTYLSCFLSSCLIDDVLKGLTHINKSISSSNLLQRLRTFAPDLFVGNFSRHMHNLPIPIEDENDVAKAVSNNESILKYYDKWYKAKDGMYVGLTINTLESHCKYKYIPTSFIYDELNTVGSLTYNYYNNISTNNTIVNGYKYIASTHRMIHNSSIACVIKSPLLSVLNDDTRYVSLSLGKISDFNRCISFVLNLPIDDLYSKQLFCEEASKYAYRSKVENHGTRVSSICNYIKRMYEQWNYSNSYEPIINAHIFKFDVIKKDNSVYNIPYRYATTLPITFKKEFNKCIIVLRMISNKVSYYSIVCKDNNPFISGSLFDDIVSYMCKHVYDDVYSLSKCSQYDRQYKAVISSDGYILGYNKDDEIHSCFDMVYDDTIQCEKGTLIDEHFKHNKQTIKHTDYEDSVFRRTYSDMPTMPKPRYKLRCEYAINNNYILYNGDDAYKLQKCLNDIGIGSTVYDKTYACKLHKMFCSK